MSALLYVGQAAVLCALLWLAWRFRELKLESDRLAKAARELGPAPADVAALLGDKPEFLAIEILNPVEVAARESALGGAIGKLAPSFIRAEVYRRMRDEFEAGLKARGIAADVRVQAFHCSRPARLPRRSRQCRRVRRGAHSARPRGR